VDFAPQLSVDSVVLARLIARESDALFPDTAFMIADAVAASRLIMLACDAPAMRTHPPCSIFAVVRCPRRPSYSS
jgi:hypothetical protein